jgi:hypothetical protein
MWRVQSLQSHNSVNVTFDIAQQPPADGSLYTLNASTPLYFVVFAADSNLKTSSNAFYRIDVAGQVGLLILHACAHVFTRCMQVCGQSGACPPGTDGCACASAACDRNLACNASIECEPCTVGTLVCESGGVCLIACVCAHRVVRAQEQARVRHSTCAVKARRSPPLARASMYLHIICVRACDRRDRSASTVH